MLGLAGWFSTNILGNRDGEVLDDPGSFRSKEVSKASVLDDILQPDQYPELYGDYFHKVRIEYYPPRGDAKEGWDNIDIVGWLGQPMQIKIDFLCRDSILAAPVVLDLILFLDLAARAGLSGIQEWLSFYFKSPMARPDLRPEHDLFVQHLKLANTFRIAFAGRGARPLRPRLLRGRGEPVGRDTETVLVVSNVVGAGLDPAPLKSAHRPRQSLSRGRPEGPFLLTGAELVPYGETRRVRTAARSTRVASPAGIVASENSSERYFTSADQSVARPWVCSGTPEMDRACHCIEYGPTRSSGNGRSEASASPEASADAVLARKRQRYVTDSFPGWTISITPAPSGPWTRMTPRPESSVLLFPASSIASRRSSAWPETDEAASAASLPS